MAAAKENINAKKLTTDELKKEAFRQYCEHLAGGRSKKSWCFEHPQLTLTWETMEKYIKEDQIVFAPIQKQIAMTKGYHKWEGVAQDSASGKNRKANTASLQMVMRNQYGWDKHNDLEQIVEEDIDKAYHALMEQLKAHQSSARNSAETIINNEQ